MATKRTRACRFIAQRKARGGWTLTEFTVAIGIGSIVLAAVALLSYYSSRSFVALGNYMDLESTSRHALDVMLRDIRQASQITSFNTNELILSGVDEAGNPASIKLSWSPATGRLTREVPAGGAAKVLLTECDMLRFSMYTRAPDTNFPTSFTNTAFTATSSPVACKLIDITYTCSRKVLGRKVNTRSVQTAQIVLRNKQATP